MRAPDPAIASRKDLLSIYASCTLGVDESDGMDATAKKLVARLAEIDEQRARLRRERDAITTALAATGWRPPDASQNVYSHEESTYITTEPFRTMSLADACLSVLRAYAGKTQAHEQWLDKSQVEYLVTRGGYPFKTGNPTNSVNITLRRLAKEGFCEAHAAHGSRATRYRFKKERLPDAIENQRATNG